MKMGIDMKARLQFAGFAALTPGFTWKKFDGSPAAMALARCTALLVERLLMNVPVAG